ncbi:MAG: hypothetical protein IKE53_00425 [Clostridiales bacterium]|nr:hypothetical protein [Clostridiales bacterium]
MGRGSYTSTDWVSLRSSKGFDKATTTYKEIFTSTCAKSAFDSRYAGIRESRDNEDSPESVPIIIGFDVTASMGYLAQELATSSINLTATLINRWVLSGAQFLTAAIGDVKSDMSPLQVTQFESDIRMIRQLMELHLEGGGGGNGGESYNLLWYFAAGHTSTDCNEKRHKKGFLFTIGDDDCHPDLSVTEIDKAFGDKAEYSMSSIELMNMAEEKYHVCHIHLNNGTTESRNIFRSLRSKFPGHVTELDVRDLHDYLPYLIMCIIKMRLGMDIQDIFSSIDQDMAVKLARPLGFMINDNRSGSSIVF